MVAWAVTPTRERTARPGRLNRLGRTAVPVFALLQPGSSKCRRAGSRIEPMRNWYVMLPSLWVLLILAAVSACRNDVSSDPSIELTEQRCTSCHLLPQPSILPKAAWYRFFEDKGRIIGMAAATRGLGSTAIPTAAELLEIRDYMIANALPQDELVEPSPLESGSSWFEAQASERLPLDPTTPSGYIDVLVDPRKSWILFADPFRGGIQAFDYSGGDVEFLPVGLGTGRMEYTRSGLLVSIMGSALSPGRVVSLEYSSDNLGTARISELLTDLRRPIRAYIGTHSGVRGLFVEEFGTFRGGLSFWPLDPSNTVGSPVAMLDAQGVVASTSVDMTGDEINDLVILVSEERETLMVFPISASGLGEPEIVFRGHPGYGFNGLLVRDLDGNGYSDLITLNGDNMDIETAPLKSYHGLRIFLNRGNLEFDEPLFLPLHGVIDAALADFDGDDDLDIFAVSAFPDYRLRPFQSAFLFEQYEPLMFRMHAVPEAWGSQWVAIGVGDFDHDGDPDVALAGAAGIDGRRGDPWTFDDGGRRLRMLLLNNVSRHSSGG